MTDTAPGSETGTDPFELAQSELKANTVPTPDDVLLDVGPLAALWYARETAYYAMRLMSATLSLTGTDDPDDGSEPVQALAALSVACGQLDGACSLLGLLPADYANSGTP